MEAPGNRAQERLLHVEDLVVEYDAAPSGRVQAVAGVTLSVHSGESVGLVGESGCGKSSLARAVMNLRKPARGEVWFKGEDLASVDPVRLRVLRSQFQMVFQDPVGSLNPARSVGESVGTPLRTLWGVDRKERVRRVREMMAAVGLDPDTFYEMYPRQLSGGQCQRVSIARAMIAGPELLVCDEPVSALDVSVQAQILNLLREMKQRYRLSVLFISHDLAVIKNVSDRVAVMYLGLLCEVASCDTLFSSARHPYTAALLAAVPRPDPSAPLPRPALLTGELPSSLHPPSGCHFRNRCPWSRERCAAEMPVLREIAPGHLVSCHFPL